MTDVLVERVCSSGDDILSIADDEINRELMGSYIDVLASDSFSVTLPTLPNEHLLVESTQATTGLRTLR